MRQLDALALVVDVACLTEDRAPEEQRAMLAIALHVDCERGSIRQVAVEPEMQRPRLMLRVMQSYDPGDGKRVEPTKAQQERLLSLYDQWKLCPDCELPRGAHNVDGVCPTLPLDVKRLREAVAR
jgi:hypothetical protein